MYTTPKCTTSIISEIKGYGLRKKPIKEETPSDEQSQINPDNNMDKLIDHTKALIDRAKTFITKLVGHKHSTKHPITSPVETDVKPKALDMLHGQTLNKLTTLHVETDGSSRPSDADSTIPKYRKIKCKMCTEIFSSVKDLNTHNRNDHGIVSCIKCDKHFNTQSSLDKHLYMHRELKFNCELCGKCFPFEGRLDQHMVTHINNKLPYPKKSCDRKFKCTGDLNCHIKTHTKGSWYHCDKCSYKNKDKCNTNSHKRTHDKEEDVENVVKKCASAPSSKDITHRDVKCKAFCCTFLLF